MNRRGFIGSILALGAAPAIVRADNLMRVVPLDTTVVTFDMARMEEITITIEGFLDRHGQLQVFSMGERLPPLSHGDTIKIRMPNSYTRRAP